MDDFEHYLNILAQTQQIIDLQKSTIDTKSDTIKLLNEVIELKDQTIDKQLQMLQLMELKLKEFGYELGSIK